MDISLGPLSGSVNVLRERGSERLVLAVAHLSGSVLSKVVDGSNGLM